jgi:hypothetical protein
MNFHRRKELAEGKVNHHIHLQDVSGIKGFTNWMCVYAYHDMVSSTSVQLCSSIDEVLGIRNGSQLALGVFSLC